jgi:dipeptidyl aminopeptidase/acylaminoacyl peptidase
MSDAPLWIRRFTATQLGFPSWADAFPDRLALLSNRSGVLQAWTVDHATGAWRQVSDEPVGVEQVFVLADGRVAWWRDVTGDERGHLVAAPFDGGDAIPVLRDVPHGWSTGVSAVSNRVAVGIESEGSFAVYVGTPGEGARRIAVSSAPLGVGRSWPSGGGLSADGALVCLRHAEHGDILHGALRVIDATDGTVVGELADDGRNLDPAAWSPMLGDARLTFTSERADRERPAIWDLESGDRRDLDVDLPGGVFPLAWFPDGGSLLARHEFEGRAQLYRISTETGSASLVADPGGDIDHAGIRPDGQVWLHATDSVRPPRTITPDGAVVVPNPDEEPPPGRPFRSFSFENPRGDRVQTFVVTPDGDGPFPTVMSVHGGPEWHERDRYDAETQAFVDAGYAVALPNYRGSTGYGIAFREALIGNVCATESEDILACLDGLVAQGIADPDLVFWSGWSWGGCLACYNAGAHPDRWRAIFAGIPAGDFVAAHWASAPELQAWDRAVHGGDPDEAPESFRRSDPMSYVDHVLAPTLVIAGENDPRCPIEGVTPWVDAVRGRGVPVDVHLYAAGHHANAAEDKVLHMRLVLDFFARHGGPAPSG